MQTLHPRDVPVVVASLLERVQRLEELVTDPGPDVDVLEHAPDDLPEEPPRNASTDDWRTFLESIGQTVSDDETRGDLIDRWDAINDGSDQ